MEFEWMSLIWLRLDTIWRVLGALLVSLGIILETIGSILRRLGHLTLNQSRPEDNLDCQGRLWKNSGQIFEDVSLVFTTLVSF